MTKFNGTRGTDVATIGRTLILTGFTGGTTVQLTDLIGDLFFAFGGNDRVISGIGNDSIFGGDGNDFIDGGAGFDSMDGGLGTDTMDVSWFTGDYVWNMSSGVTGFSRQGEFALNFENGRTGSGNDNVFGTGGANVIQTNAGNDTIDGGAGNDSLYGGAGNDELVGGSGLDFLYGGAGNDRLFGKPGNDFLYGGAGEDTLIGGFDTDLFFFDTDPSSVDNVDRIIGFDFADDTIVLDSAIFTNLAVGFLPDNAFRYGPFATSPTHRIIYNRTTGNMSYDPDGVGGMLGSFFAHVEPGTKLFDQDFLVI